MLRMPRPQPTMSLRQQESGTEAEAREKVVSAQSRYEAVPQHPNCNNNGNDMLSMNSNINENYVVSINKRTV